LRQSNREAVALEASSPPNGLCRTSAPRGNPIASHVDSIFWRDERRRRKRVESAAQFGANAGTLTVDSYGESDAAIVDHGVAHG